MKAIQSYFDEHVNDYLTYKKNDPYKKLLSNIKNSTILSLGCGAGREIKQLVEQNNRVIGVDFSANMISKARELEPKGIYFEQDVCEFVKNNVGILKVDYIIGIFSLLGYIPQEKRKALIEGCLQLLNKDGNMLFTVNSLNSPKDIIKTIIALIISPLKYELGDVFSIRDKTITHQFTNNQIKQLMFNAKIEIRII